MIFHIERSLAESGGNQKFQLSVRLDLTDDELADIKRFEYAWMSSFLRVRSAHEKLAMVVQSEDTLRRGMTFEVIKVSEAQAIETALTSAVADLARRLRVSREYGGKESLEF